MGPFIPSGENSLGYDPCWVLRYDSIIGEVMRCELDIWFVAFLFAKMANSRMSDFLLPGDDGTNHLIATNGHRPISNYYSG